MRTIGFRASASSITYCILNCDEQKSSSEILALSELRLPKALAQPDRLQFLRSTILDILDEYHVLQAGIRIAEKGRVNRNISHERIQIEGVLQELISSSVIEKYFCGNIANIMGKIKINPSSFKDWISGLSKPPFLPNEWSKFTNENDREAIITAYAATKL